MRIHGFALVLTCAVASLAIGTGASIPVAAQESTSESIQHAPFVASRIVERVDDSRLVRLPGNTHPSALAKYDRGLVDAQLPLERMQLLLKRSSQQEAALEKLMEEQTNPKSSNFQHWLTAEEFGQAYGPSDSDLAAVTSWLQNHGFQIYQVNKGRVTIEFSGTAAQVQETFHTEIHHYLVNGKMHIANDRDPQIPEALAPVVGGVASLHDFFPTHQSIKGRYVRRDPKTGKITPVDSAVATGPAPQFGFTNESGNPEEDVTPYDFATIYNLLPLWNAGITGKGQTIAISAVTDIVASDVATFRKTLGLGSFTGTIKQVVNGTDPGVVQGDQVENTLDTEWSGAAAPDADVVVVISADTSTTPGFILSDSYIVNNPSIAHIMSASYGTCEIGIGTSGNQAINSIYQQGAAEGISIFESSGDQGSTGCDNSDATTFPAPAGYGLQVNGYASSPYVTAVGGTDFAWQNYRTTYWGATNSSTNLSNALGYIPEIPWNNTCTSQLLLDRFWNPQYGFTTLEEVCNQVVNGNVVSAPEFLKVTGGSGGVSACITSTNGEFSTCGGGYAQPSWQKGVVGMPGTQSRYLPDVSLFAASGYPYGLNGSAYLICVASNSEEKTCDYTDNTQIVYQEVGGTSVSSPALAGIMALVQQKQNGKAQGLANPYFYALHAKDNLTSCNSSTVKSTNSCNFYDVTYGTNAQPCTTGSRNCVTNTSGDQYGVVSGYSTTTGYDQATGLGSVNATNLVNNWPSSAATETLAVSPTSLAFASTAVGATTAAQVVTIKNTGTAAVTLTSETITGAYASSFVKSATTCTTSLAVGASCTVSVEFKPAAAGALTASLSIADNATGSPQTVALSGTGVNGGGTTATFTFSPTSITFPATAVGGTSATQVLTIKNTGSVAATVSSYAISGTNAAEFAISAKTCGTSVAAGASCTLSLVFKPTAAGSASATFVSTDSAAGSPQSVPLAGSTSGGTTATFTFSPTSITFPATAVGASSAAQVLTIKNTGSVAATVSSYAISGTNAAEFAISAKTCGTSLAVGASCTLSLVFKPTAAGSASANFVSTDSASGSPQSVALAGSTSGGGTTATFTFSPTSITFPATAVGGTSATQVLTIKNTGSVAATVSSYAISGTNAAEFAISGKTCGTSLAVGASCTLSLVYKPTATGSASATFVSTDSAAGSPQSVALAGSTSGGGTTATFTFTPTSITFPATAVGGTSATQVLTIKNTGSVAATVSSYAISGTNAAEFAISGKTCGTSVAAGASCTISIIFKPTAAGSASAKLVSTDSASGSPQSVALAGSTSGGGSAATFTFSPTSITFATTKAGGTSAAQVLTIKNTGSIAATVSSYSFLGTNPSDFAISGKTCGSSLAAGASCTLSLVFKPAATGAASASLLATDSATGSPQSVPLKGTGD